MYVYICMYIYVYMHESVCVCMLCMPCMHATVDGNNSAPLCMSCIPCILRTHAYIQYTRTRPRTQKPETLEQNQAQTTGQPRRRRGFCGPGLILLERRWFLRACARACVLYVCMRAEYAWYACMHMHAYTCMHIPTFHLLTFLRALVVTTVAAIGK